MSIHCQLIFNGNFLSQAHQRSFQLSALEVHPGARYSTRRRRNQARPHIPLAEDTVPALRLPGQSISQPVYLQGAQLRISALLRSREGRPLLLLADSSCHDKLYALGSSASAIGGLSGLPGTPCGPSLAFARTVHAPSCAAAETSAPIFRQPSKRKTKPHRHLLYGR